MKTNLVKQKLRGGEPSIGTWLSLGNLIISRVLARSGFEWLTVCLEHGAIDLADTAAAVGAIADAGCVPLVRVPEGNHTWIKRVLDLGAWGIVVPMVESVEQARVAIAAAKYPPQGNRSVGGGSHAMSFGGSVNEYFDRANDEILVVLQIESPRGIENAQQIAQLPGCDALFIGPADLRHQMRQADGTFPTPEEHEAAVQQVLQIGKQTGTPVGIHTLEPRDALRRVEQGMQLVAVGSEVSMLVNGMNQMVEVLFPEKVGRDVARY